MKDNNSNNKITNEKKTPTPFFVRFIANPADQLSKYLNNKTGLNLQDWILGLMFYLPFLGIIIGSRLDFRILLNYQQFLILWVTFIVILWYSKETYWLKHVNEKLLNQQRYIGDYELMPFLRIQFVSFELHRFLCLVNDGRGLAKNTNLKLLEDNQKYNIKEIPVIASGPNNPSGIDPEHIIDLSENEFGTWRILDENDSFAIKIMGGYRDIKNRKYRVSFTYNKSVKDRFKIDYQEPDGWQFGSGL